MKVRRISAIVPTRDRHDQLAAAIASVLGQTSKPLEVVVVDDGSEPPVSLSAFAGSEVPIRLLRHEAALGPSAARNTGAGAANGDFVAFLDDDDTWVPWKLEAVQSCLRVHPDADVAIHGTGARPNSRDRVPECSIITSPMSRMLHRQPASLDGVVIRRSLHMETPFDEAFAGAEDLDYLIRIAKTGAVIVESGATLAVLGDSPGSAVGLDKRIAGRLLLLKHHPEISRDRRALAFFYLRLGHLYRQAKSRRDAFRAFAKSFAIRPSLSATRGIVLCCAMKSAGAPPSSNPE